ncbi:MAG: class I SAM-dependent methyltransferase [Candidatus Berkiella sp.]
MKKIALLIGLMFMNSVFSSDGSHTYTLATGTLGSERLALQDKVLSAQSYLHLEKAGLSEGMVVYEIGCGNGMMTTYIANKVGANGHVYALDISQAQIDLAKERIQAQVLSNVTFVLADINHENTLPLGKADIVYSRFVLMHLQTPANAITKMKTYLKPGGVVASQESIMKTWHTTYQPEIFDDYVNKMIALGQLYGVDYNLGQNLDVLYKKEGFDKVAVYYHQQSIAPGDAKKLILLGMAEKRPRTLEANIVSPKAFELWEKAAQAIPEDDTSFTYNMAKQAYVLAWNEK